MRALYLRARPLLPVAVIFVLLSLGGNVVSGAIVKDSIDSGATRQKTRLFTAQVNGCRRQNVKQATTNKNVLAEWRFNSLFASALTQPQPNQTAAQRALLPHFQARLKELVDSLAWTPLNHDCAHDPTAVQLPVFFSTRRPTKADLPASRTTK